MLDFEFTDDEMFILQHIINTGGYDYDVWPAIDNRLMPTLKDLENKEIISVQGDGDIHIVNLDVYQYVEREMDNHNASI